ncbi:cystathionine gamma-lyase [Paroceanicella profunda]|uniref:Cystathionine gamma-lyase n=1 Tax=Paroceanicella profunda TaxID=2579971 RepID=A0A5B8FU41_9RHOB|nr:cystathionine gamma-lyase [Paroceanicella profunda]QDL90774.1 cystathionine gamma-lyase [Paroceanicella profunda]
MTTPPRDDRALTLLHHRSEALRKGDPLSLPLTLSSVFHLPGDPQAEFTYGRFSTPVWQELEAQLAVIEAAECIVFPSGMAAIAAVFYAHLKSGDRVLMPSDGYYTGRVLLERFLVKLGVEPVFLPTRDFATTPLDGLAMAFIETPSNPGLDVCDIRAFAARARPAGVVTVVDNTTCTAYLQQPLDLGADLVVMSDTKSSAGHSDVLLGHVAGRDAALMQPIRDWRTLSGAIAGPFEAWLTHRGLETLDVRLERMCRSAGVIAGRFAEHPAVQSVRYPGLASDPSHEIAARQMSAFGFIISLSLESAEAAEAFITGCPALAATTSFGGVHSSAERRARWGDAVAPGFVRLSVGCEPTEALWSAFAAALPG